MIEEIDLSIHKLIYESQTEIQPVLEPAPTIPVIVHPQTKSVL